MSDLQKYHILDSIPDISTYKSVTDRYFSRRYVLNADNITNNDLMLLFHSNRVTLLTLAPSHHFFKKEGNYKINFTCGKIDRLSNYVKGKGKKGGQHLNPKSVICKIEYDDGTSFDILSGMKASLVEVNECLVKNPYLLRDFPDSNGFIAIMLSSIENAEAVKNGMMTHEEYLKTLQSKD